MIPYRDEKIKNAANFFAQEHRKRAGKPLYQTHLYKYLTYLEFYSIKETGMPALGLTFRAMTHGPVPLEVYQEKEAVTGCKFVQDQFGEQVIPTSNPDLDYFSEYELKLMKQLLDRFSHYWITANDMSESTHKDINAWKRTRKNEIIDPALEFEGNIFEKKDEDLTFPELVYLTQQALST